MSWWDSITDSVEGAWNGLTDTTSDLWDAMTDSAVSAIEGNDFSGQSNISTQGSGANDSNNIAPTANPQTQSMNPMYIGLAVLVLLVLVVLFIRGGK